MKPEPLFYIPREGTEQEVDGPYDLAQLALLLRTQVITPETLTFREGEEEWKPFGARPQYAIAVEMPAGAKSRRMEEREMAASAPKAPIPLPSGRLTLQILLAALGLGVGGVIAFYVASANMAAGMCLLVIGSCLALIGQAFILVHLLDEGMITRLLVLFLPLFDIYYFTANLEKYLPWFAAKYVGAVLAAAAFVGLSTSDASLSAHLWEIVEIAKQQLF